MSARPLQAMPKLLAPASGYTNGDAIQPSPLQGALESNVRLAEQVAQLRGALAQARRDLKGTRAGERKARHSAEHDGLTQLPNRLCFETRLQDALAEPITKQQGLALFFLDLDDFKQVNDTHGHAAGDTLLQVVAARLNQAVRKEDMVCRLAGDEFACLLHGLVQTRQLMQLAAKLFDTVAAPYQLDTFRLSVRPSIGIAVFPQDGVTGPELLARADAAMYRPKRQQTGYAFFETVT